MPLLSTENAPDKLSAINPATAPKEFMPAHIRALDGVRGIAILLVIAHHWIQSSASIPIHGYLQSIAIPLAFVGQTGVDLFFVLSGFLITRILLSVKAQPNGIRNFYCRRALRIFPLYYMILFAVIVLTPADVRHDQLRMNAHDTGLFWLWGYGANFAQWYYKDWLYGALDHFWSLAIEEHFYLFFPFLVLLCNKRTLTFACLALIAVSIGSRAWFFMVAGNGIAPYILTFCRLDGLVCGALLALAERSHLLTKRLSMPLAGLLVCFTAASIGVHYNLLGPWGPSLLSSFEALLFAAFIALAVIHKDGIIGKVCGNPVLVFFGIYSYGLYAYHHILRPPLVPVTLFYDVHKPNNAAVSYGLFHLALCTVVAVLSYHLIEKQFLKLKSRFSSVEN
jgi:peptidoglycan/LPS O-acetylase OafA/YrhL